MTHRRTIVLTLSVATLLLTAGCVQFGTTTETATTAPTATPTETPRPSTETPTDTERPTETATPEPVGTGSLPYDLTIRNTRDGTVTMNVTIVENATGDRILSREVTLDHRESVDFEVPFPAPGNYTVSATVDATEGDFHTTDRYVWEVERLPPSFTLEVTARPDGTVTFTGISA